MEEFRPDIDVQPPAKESPQLVRQRRLLNRWSVFALVAVTAGATVLYVSNVIQVNRLLRDVESRTKTLDSLQSVHDIMRREVYRLQSAERVTRLASERLGMIPPQKAPVVLRSEEE